MPDAKYQRSPGLANSPIVAIGSSLAAARVTGLVARLPGKHVTVSEVKTVLRARPAMQRLGGQ